MEPKSVQQEFMEKSIQKINKRRKLFFCFCIFIVLLGPAVVFLVTVSETHSLGRELLGEERYGIRMGDSYLYSAVLLVFMLLVVIPVGIRIHKFFNRYLAVLPTLSSMDILKAEALNQHLGMFQKYLPPYVFRGEDVIFFRLLSTSTIPLKAITKIKVTRVARRGGSVNVVRIYTPDSTNRFPMDAGFYLLENLLKEALDVNPTIEIIRTEGWM